jgi:hypothetical protein
MTGATPNAPNTPKPRSERKTSRRNGTEGKLEKLFLALVERIRATPPPGNTARITAQIAARPRKPEVRLAGEAGALYETVRGSFLSAYSGEELSPVSTKEVERLLDRAIQDTLGARGQYQQRRTRGFAERSRQQARLLLDLVAAEPGCWTVYLPLHAPLVSKRTVFGPATFVPGTPSTMRRLLSGAPAFASEMNADTVASVTVLAVDALAAQHRAIHTLRETLDVLDFVAPRIRAPYLTPAAAFEPVEMAGESWAVAVGPTRNRYYSKLVYYPQIRRLPPLRERGRIQRRIHELLTLQQPSAMQRRIINGLAWAGRANTQRRREQAFLMHMIALESALTRADSRGFTTERLCVRVSHVLGGNAEARAQAFASTTRLYRLRCEIVHSGAAMGVREDDLAQLADLTRRVMTKLLSCRVFRQMTTENDMETWFTAQLL